MTARSGPQIGYLVRLAGRAAGPGPLRPPRTLFADAGHPLDDGSEASPDLPADHGPGPRPAVPVRADGLADGPAAPAEVRFSPAAAEAAELPAGPRGTAPGGVPRGDPAPVAPVSGTASADGMAPAPLHLTTPPGWELGPSGPGTAGRGTAGPGAAGWGRTGLGAAGLPGGGAGAFLDLPAAAAGSGAPAAPSPPTAPPPSSPAPPPAPALTLPALTLPALTLPALTPPALTPPALNPPAPGRPAPGGPGPAAPPVPDWLRGTPVTQPSAPTAPAQPSLSPEGAGTPRAGQEAADGRQADVGPDLMPPRARVARPDEHARTGQSRPEPPARVTIGTIEVTVVPAAGPARGGTEPPMAPPPGVPPRSASGLTGAGGARLRDGLRRWYGIAQG